MVFVYIGIATVVIFLFLIILMKRNEIKQAIKNRPKRVKKDKPEPKVVEDPDTKVNDDNIKILDEGVSLSEQYNNIDEFLNPHAGSLEHLDDLDDFEYQNSFDRRMSEFFDDIPHEGPDEEEFKDVFSKQIKIGQHSMSSEKMSAKDFDDYDEVADEMDYFRENASLSKRFADLPDDMKALMLADIFKRKY